MLFVFTKNEAAEIGIDGDQNTGLRMRNVKKLFVGGTGPRSRLSMTSWPVSRSHSG